MWLSVWVCPKELVDSLGPRGVYLALASIQCFIVVSKAPESPDSKSAGCKDVTLGEIELITFEKKIS